MDNRQLVLREVYLFLKELNEDLEIDLGAEYDDRMQDLLVGMRVLLRPPITSLRNVHWRCLGCDSMLEASESSYAENNEYKKCSGCETEYRINWGIGQKDIYVEVM